MFIGNVAFLRCFIPEYVRQFVVVTSWYRGEEILLPELADVGKRLYFFIKRDKYKKISI